MRVCEVIDLERVTLDLAQTRPVFHSEADFQFSLAILLHELYRDLAIRLDIPQSHRITLDMLITSPSGDDSFAIELKYQSALWSGDVVGQAFHLQNHGADDIGGYDIVKDVARIESLVADGSGQFRCGHSW